MTGSAVVTIACGSVLVGWLAYHETVLYREHRRELARRAAKHRARTAEFEQRDAAIRRAPLVTVPARMPARPSTSLAVCEAAWSEALELWNLAPDADLIDEFNQFCQALDERGLS